MSEPPYLLSWQHNPRVHEIGASPKSLLLVLDSFEAAQYEGRHAELWPFIEALGERVQGLRVLVSGRVPVPSLSMKGNTAEAIHLPSLDDASARAWLAEEGIREPSTVETILSVTRKLPLNLVLAADLFKSGDSLEDLSKTLPQKLIQGYLYRRILRRVSTEALRRLARGALVLRRLTADMVYPVLGKACGIEEKDAAEGFSKLAKELALVEGTTVLRHRPDVRNAVLSLLETEDPAWVKSIEQEAVRWYSTQDTQDPEIATELVYHRLRLGDLEGAKRAWLQGVRSRMGSFAFEEVPEPGRSWLSTRGQTPTESPLEEWEQDASERIREALQRELWRAVHGILEERSERSPNSPLVFLEAYAHWKEGETARALQVLAVAEGAEGIAARNQAVLRACLAEARGERAEAERWLEPLCAFESWSKRSGSNLEWMAVIAARVRLTVDLDAEKRFAESCKEEPLLRKLLSESDLVLPHVQEMLRWPDISHSIDLEASRYHPGAFKEALLRYLSVGPLECRVVHQILDKYLDSLGGRWTNLDIDQLSAELRATLKQTNWPGGLNEGHLNTVFVLAWQAAFRWSLVSRYPLLDFINKLVTFRHPADLHLASAILAQAAPFSSPNLTIEGYSGSLHKVIEKWLRVVGWPAGDKRHALWLLDRLPGGAPFPERVQSVGFEKYLVSSLREARRPHWIPAALHVMAPSPLPRLVERLVEIPD